MGEHTSEGLCRGCKTDSHLLIPAPVPDQIYRYPYGNPFHVELKLRIPNELTIILFRE
jgi:hypothetical protein